MFWYNSHMAFLPSWLAVRRIFPFSIEHSASQLSRCQNLLKLPLLGYVARTQDTDTARHNTDTPTCLMKNRRKKTHYTHTKRRTKYPCFIAFRLVVHWISFGVFLDLWMSKFYACMSYLCPSSLENCHDTSNYGSILLHTPLRGDVFVCQLIS